MIQYKLYFISDCSNIKPNNDILYFTIVFYMMEFILILVNDLH